MLGDKCVNVIRLFIKIMLVTLRLRYISANNDLSIEIFFIYTFYIIYNIDNHENRELRKSSLSLSDGESK